MGNRIPNQVKNHHPPAVLAPAIKVGTGNETTTEISWIPPLIATCFAGYLFFRLYTEPAKEADKQTISGPTAASETTGI